MTDLFTAHKILNMCTPLLDLIHSFCSRSKNLRLIISFGKVKPLTDQKYQNFVRALEFLEHHEEYCDFLYDYVMASISICEGLKVHGAKGKASVMNEIKNLVSHECSSKVPLKSLTDKQKKQALLILMFILLKHDEKLKSRGCADGHPQCLWTTKQEVSSPIPAFEVLKYILTIIDLVARDVTSFDLLAQFLQIDMDEILHLKITGAFALLLIEYDKERWNKHFRKNRVSWSYTFYARKLFMGL